MAHYNVLVTGVGAIIGYGVIKCLRDSVFDCSIFGMDIYKDAVGQAWCDEFIRAIPANDSGYVDFLERIIRHKHIDLIIFGTEQELHRIVFCKNDFVKSHCVLNHTSLYEIADDKWKTYKFLNNNKLLSIPSSIDDNFDAVVKMFGLPFLLKPRKSYAGKGIKKISDKEEFAFFSARIDKDNYMVQKYIGDDNHEYTTSTFGFGDGVYIGAITMRRTLSQEGATQKAYMEDIPAIEEYISKIVSLVKPIGPTNFQFRYDDGKYYLLEINPRISSATSIRKSFGYNEAEMCIKWFLEQKPFILQPKDIKKGYALRYIDEWVYFDEDGNHF